ncbi:rhomboid family intramembrane serine protease [Sulfurovum sp. ST-21]
MQEFQRYPLTYLVILLNSAVYLFSSIYSGSIVEMNLRVLVDMGALYGPLTVLHGEWWRLFTAMFLHGGMTHLLMNMVSIYLIGRGMELYFEKKAYISIYLFAGLVGGLVSLLVHPESVGIGASGAIFGVFGALAGFFLAHRKRRAVRSQAFMKDFAVIMGINLVLGFSIESIDVTAHIAGLVAGFTGGFMLSRQPRLIWVYGLVMLGVIISLVRYLPYYYAQYYT